jgi:hypothetical protein
MAFQTGTATDVHDMLQILSTFVAANGWTVDNDAVDGAGRELQVSNGESFFSLRSGTTETLATLDIPIRASNTIETGIWINGMTGYDGAKTWNRHPGRMGRWSDGNPIPFWLDTNGNTGSFDYFLYAWASPTPEVYLVVEYQTGPSRYGFLSFGEMEQIHDWGFTRGVPYFTASRNSYPNTVAITDEDSGAGGPFQSCGGPGNTVNQYARTAFRFKPANVDGDEGFLGPPDNSSGTSPWSTITRNLSTNSVYGWTGRSGFGLDHLADDLMRAGPSTFNQADILIPFYITRTRIPQAIDPTVTQNAIEEYSFSLIGVPNHSRYVDMTNLLPGDELTVGADTWQVWPAHYIGQTIESSWRTVGSQMAQYGFAVRKA